MNEYQVSNAKITFTDEVRPAEKAGVVGSERIAIIETTDLLKAEVSIQEFDDGTKVIRLTEFLGDEPPRYTHLQSNGRLPILMRPNGDWMVLLRALRPGGKPYPTLNSVSFEELDELLGVDSKKWLENLGFEIDEWQKINPAAGRYKNGIGLAIHPSKAHLLVLPWTLTRVIALMKRLGKSTHLEVQ